MGSLLLGLEDSGLWSKLEKKENISVLELKAAKFAILTFTKIFAQAKIIHFQMDNIAALSYTAESWVYHDRVLSDLAKEIWDYFLANSIMITVKCLPGTLKGPSIKYVRSKEEEWGQGDQSLYLLFL